MRTYQKYQNRMAEHFTQNSPLIKYVDEIYELPLKQKEKCGRKKGKLHLQWLKIISEEAFFFHGSCFMKVCSSIEYAPK